MTTAASSKTSKPQRKKKQPQDAESPPSSPTEKHSGASTPRPLSALRPNPKNPRLPFTDAQADAFKRSLAEYGDLSGIVENKRTGNLVGGHKRVQQFQQDEAATIAFTHHLEAPDASGTLAYGYVETVGTRFAYRLVDWPESKEKAICGSNCARSFSSSLIGVVTLQDVQLCSNWIRRGCLRRLDSRRQ
jgi:hypothetical protein